MEAETQNGRHFADDTFKRIFLNENFWISNKISLAYVLWGLLDNRAALVQIMACRRSRDKPLSGPRIVRVLTHICVTGRQWVNGVNEAEWRIWASVNRTIIGSDHWLLPVRQQVIIGINVGLLLTEPMSLNQIWIKTVFIQGYEFGNIVWKMTAISSRWPIGVGNCRLCVTAYVSDIRK